MSDSAPASTSPSSSSAYTLPSSIPTYYPPLPSDHPPIPAHVHKAGKCPFTAKHEYCSPQEGDIRSPCPALNTMANHGYINRDGQNLSANALVRGLMSCYNLSLPLAIVLSYGGFFLLHKYNLFQNITLHDVAKHGYVEHDASLVHRNVDDNVDEKVEVIKKRFWGLLGEKKAERFYASIDINQAWVEELVRDARIDQEDHSANLYPFAASSTDDAQGQALGQAPASPLPPSLPPTSATVTRAHPLTPLTIQPPTPNIDGLPSTFPSTIEVRPSSSGTAQEVTYIRQTHRTLGTTGSDLTTPSTGANSLFSNLGSIDTAATSPSSSPVSSKFKTLQNRLLGTAGSESASSARSSPSPDIPGEVYTDELVESPTATSRQNTTFPVSASSSRTTSIALTSSQSAYASNYETPKGSNRILLSPRALARSRVRREYESWSASGGKKKLDAVHAEIARGEMAIVLGMWGVEVPVNKKDDEDNFPGEGNVLDGTKKSKRLSSIFSSSSSSPSVMQQQTHKGVPIEWLREWIAYERLPGGWRKMKKQGLLETVKMSRTVKQDMEALRAIGVGAIPDTLPESGDTLGSEPKGLNVLEEAKAGVKAEFKEAEEVVKAKKTEEAVLGEVKKEMSEKEPEIVSYRGWRAGGEF